MPRTAARWTHSQRALGPQRPRASCLLARAQRGQAWERERQRAREQPQEQAQAPASSPPAALAPPPAMRSASSAAPRVVRVPCATRARVRPSHPPRRANASTVRASLAPRDRALPLPLPTPLRAPSTLRRRACASDRASNAAAPSARATHRSRRAWTASAASHPWALAPPTSQRATQQHTKAMAFGSSCASVLEQELLRVQHGPVDVFPRGERVLCVLRVSGRQHGEHALRLVRGRHSAVGGKP